MGAPSKRARKVRAASEFDLGKLIDSLRTPTTNVAAYSWSLEDIVNARNEQMRGYFKIPARLAESMRTDDALFIAKKNRLAPQRCVKVKMLPAKGARGAFVANEAEALFGQGGIAVQPDTLTDINGTFVDHGVAFATCTPVPRADGSRVDYTVSAWPIEFVRWAPQNRCFMALTDMGEVPIVHGDGRWIVFRENEIEPFKHGAILAGALVWARHAFAIRDWAKGSVAHGNAKVIGSMPEGVALQALDADGNQSLSAEGAAMLALLRDIASADSPIGIKPAGSTVDYLTNNSNAWQVWNELTQNAEKAAARIYLGTDGVLGSQGGAPGVDIGALFGVAATLVEGDLRCLERGIFEGVIQPWCAMNFGDSSLAPQRVYMLPDADADQARASMATRKAAFFSELQLARENGFAITQDYVNQLAAEHGVAAPILAAAQVAPPAVVAPAAPASPLLFEVFDLHTQRFFHMSDPQTVQTIKGLIQEFTVPTGTAAPVSTETFPRAERGVLIQSMAANTAVIYVGGSSLELGNGLELAVGASIVVPIDTAKDLFAISGTPGQKIRGMVV